MKKGGGVIFVYLRFIPSHNSWREVGGCCFCGMPLSFLSCLIVRWIDDEEREQEKVGERSWIGGDRNNSIADSCI